MVTVKNAYGNNEGLWHYSTRLIERTAEHSINVYPYDSASSARAINQWFDTMGYDLKLTRRGGGFQLFPTKRGSQWVIEETAEGFSVKHGG